MKNFLDDLKIRLEEELDEVEAKTRNLLDRFTMGAQKAVEAVAELKKKVLEQGFNCKEEEIYFFKHIQPDILSKKIYYGQLFRIEANHSRSVAEDHKKFLDRELLRIDLFFEEHNDLRLYYQGGRTNKDEQYYLRDSHYNNEYPVEVDGVLDTRFCTVTSFKLAEIMAYQQVRQYLQAKLDQLNGLFPDAALHPKLKWTGSKTDLLELVYGLHTANCFNHGRADLKQIIDWLEKSLGIDLSNSYGFLRDIRRRKKEQIIFLTYLRDCLQRRIQDGDEDPEK